MTNQYFARPYSEECIQAIFEQFKTVRSTLVVMATGLGKTEIYLQVAERFLDANLEKRCLIIAHREELIMQPARRWRRNLNEWPAIEMGELRSDVEYEEFDLFDSVPVNRRCVIASIQTLNSGRRCTTCTADCQTCNRGKIIEDCHECDRTGQILHEGESDPRACFRCEGDGQTKRKCKDCQGAGWICILDECDRCFEHFVRRMQKFSPKEFGLIIIDEGHHAVADSYKRYLRYVWSRNPGAKVLLLTATPDRADEEALGQVCESVAYEYSLPQPIFDGWLTPIDQQFVLVDELNLSNVRTTAGDLNSGDLEAEMMAEKVLHKVITPLIEIACGLEQGTIDDLIRESRISELASLCTKNEPTLIHAVDVAHAERMTEIINRYLPDSALCIIGTTPKNIRRDGLKRFADGGYQFLLSCGVFLEGTDLPNVSIIGMARPTKSRALYAQMLGRGLRPVPNLVDSLATREERVRAIAQSSKHRCLCVDFVGNSGRHKLISVGDILGGEMPDDLVDNVIRKAAQEGQPVDMLQALSRAREEEEERKRRQARQEAEERVDAQRLAAERAAQRRAGIVAGATWTTRSVDPFDVMDLAPKREPGWHKGRSPTESQKDFLRKAGVPFTNETTFWQAHLLVQEVIKRRNKGFCTYKQAKWLKEHGYSGDTSFDLAGKIMNAWKRNDWRPPPEYPPTMSA